MRSYRGVPRGSRQWSFRIGRTFRSRPVQTLLMCGLGHHGLPALFSSSLISRVSRPTHLHSQPQAAFGQLWQFESFSLGWVSICLLVTVTQLRGVNPILSHDNPSDTGSQLTGDRQVGIILASHRTGEYWAVQGRIWPQEGTLFEAEDMVGVSHFGFIWILTTSLNNFTGLYKAL